MLTPTKVGEDEGRARSFYHTFIKAGGVFFKPSASAYEPASVRVDVLGRQVLTYAHVCSRMLTYAHVCSRMLASMCSAARCTRMPTYAHVCSRMLTYAHVCSRRCAWPPGAHVCSRMLTYAHVCSRMLTYAHVCLQVVTLRVPLQQPLRALGCLTYADVC
jgi:hypothetical protein